jgi:hypothetical protein
MGREQISAPRSPATLGASHDRSAEKLGSWAGHGKLAAAAGLETRHAKGLACCGDLRCRPLPSMASCRPRDWGAMNRLQKFIEQGAYGEGPGRTAYALDPAKLPEPNAGFEWRAVSDFRPGEAIFADKSLKSVFERALKTGIAVVSRD